MIQPLIKYPYHASLAGGGVNNLSDMMYHQLQTREAIQLEIRTLQVPLNLLIYACLKKLSQDLTFSIISFISNILNFWENAACLFPSMHILSLRLWMWVIQVTFTDLCIYLSVGLWLLWWKWFCHIYKSKKKTRIQTNNSIQNLSIFWYFKAYYKLVSSNRISKIKIW